jgi:hypothetical protein
MEELNLSWFAYHMYNGYTIIIQEVGSLRRRELVNIRKPKRLALIYFKFTFKILKMEINF